MDSPFFTFAEALQARYGARTYKLTLSGGRTCPTRDGTYGPKKGWGGCTFCDAHGSASFFANEHRDLSVAEQMERAAVKVREKFRAEKFIAYFQSYTTTHEEIEEIRPRYEEAVRFPGVVRLAVGTRPDCLPPEMLDLLCAYLDRVDVQLELGVQSFNDEVLSWYDRGHDAARAVDALERAMSRSRELDASGAVRMLDVSAHLIFGAPQETERDLVETARVLNRIGVHGVKLHHLHVLKRTKLERRYAAGEFPLLEMEPYLERVALFLRHLDPGIAIHRVHGTAPHFDELVGPEWTKWRARPNERLKQMMTERGWRQGDRA
ncbi:MAG: TIGR01212 family radical SAM protein [Bdellovibrionales bacterium]|nr:TIGR01212 family radical SAM protein [Bdellovibrionales bacterium]